MVQMTARLHPPHVVDILPYLSHLWHHGLSREATRGPATIGVCVSGGPDSMAMAYLLKQIPRVDSRIRIEPLAFIVNHNAREGSMQEVISVSRQLEKLDIRSRILNMEWPKKSDPLSLSDFEMRAREMRYRLIAVAAIRAKIHHLFLGHHRGDQIETILMRLTRNSTVSFLGLQGMSENSAIPCCEDIRGAHETEDHGDFPDHPGEVSEHLSGSADGGAKGVALSRPNGRLQLHRPLLQYDKSRLISLCEINNILYVRDKTNFDPTLTLRNAIRHLRVKYKLPRALQGESVLQLHAWARKSYLSLQERGKQCLDKTKVVAWDLRSGLMTISVSQDFISTFASDPEACAYAIARITSIISPQSRDGAPIVIPLRRIKDFVTRTQSVKSSTLNIEQVLFEKDPSTVKSPQEEVIWKLSRPPMRDFEVEHCTQEFTQQGIPVQDVNKSNWLMRPRKHGKVGLWSDWLLWDHRLWIRIWTADSAQLKRIGIRPYRISDATHLKKTLNREQQIALQSKLADAAPGKLRYTLPVLTVDSHVSIFPTLGCMVQRSNSDPVLEWEVFWKVIDHAFIDNNRATIRWNNG